MTRGKIANLAGISFGTFRFYEYQGLLKPSRIKENGYHVYEEDTLMRLSFIKSAKEGGFSLAEIKSIFLVTDSTKFSLDQAEQIICNKLDEIEKKIATLELMKTTLQKIQVNIHDPKCPHLKSIFASFKDK